MNLKLSSLITLITLVSGLGIYPKATANPVSSLDLPSAIDAPQNNLQRQIPLLLADKTSNKSPKTKKNAQFNCDEALTQLEMSQCTVSESAHTEKQLKKIYHQLETQNSGDVEQLNLLKQTQSLWLKYRETSCQFASSQYEGGSIQPLIYSSCITGLTKERVKNLETYLLP